MVQQLWSDLAESLHNAVDIMANLNAKSVLLGCIQSSNDILINHIFSITKRYIYITKCTEGVLNITRLVSIILFHYNLEKNISIFRGNQPIFERNGIFSLMKLLVCNLLQFLL